MPLLELMPCAPPAQRGCERPCSSKSQRSARSFRKCFSLTIFRRWGGRVQLAAALTGHGKLKAISSPSGEVLQVSQGGYALIKEQRFNVQASERPETKVVEPVVGGEPVAFRRAEEGRSEEPGPGAHDTANTVSALDPSRAVRRCAPGGAVGSVGGFLIPRGFGASIAATGGPYLALEIFLLFYITCIALTWWYYLRKTSSLAKARV